MIDRDKVKAVIVDFEGGHNRGWVPALLRETTNCDNVAVRRTLKNY